MRKKIVAGNWKMNKTPSEAVALVNELKDLVKNDDVDVVYCVPAIDIVHRMQTGRYYYKRLWPRMDKDE